MDKTLLINWGSKQKSPKKLASKIYFSDICGNPDYIYICLIMSAPIATKHKSPSVDGIAAEVFSDKLHAMPRPDRSRLNKIAD
jgi:hypothetical protein